MEIAKRKLAKDKRVLGPGAEEWSPLKNNIRVWLLLPPLQLVLCGASVVPCWPTHTEAHITLPCFIKGPKVKCVKPASVLFLLILFYLYVYVLKKNDLKKPMQCNNRSENLLMNELVIASQNRLFFYSPNYHAKKHKFTFQDCLYKNKKLQKKWI